MYTPGQVEALINNIIKNRDREDEFSVFKYSVLKTELPLLYDLLGTKYIRQNKLTKAMKSFKKVDVKLWNEKYSNWERSNNGWYYGGDIFDQNPFYVIKYTPEFIPIKDTVRINKYTVTRQLIKYINKAENPKEKNKDYYYFLVGNCYYNMTHYGNAWMMRRYYWTGSGNPTSIEDLLFVGVKKC
jgi:tetratricopeptide (TPR) repeat protein